MSLLNDPTFVALGNLSHILLSAYVLVDLFRRRK